MVIIKLTEFMRDKQKFQSELIFLHRIQILLKLHSKYQQTFCLFIITYLRMIRERFCSVIPHLIH